MAQISRDPLSGHFTADRIPASGTELGIGEAMKFDSRHVGTALHASSTGRAGADESLDRTDIIQAPEIHSIRIHAANAGGFHLFTL